MAIFESKHHPSRPRLYAREFDFNLGRPVGVKTKLPAIEGLKVQISFCKSQRQREKDKWMKNIYHTRVRTFTQELYELERIHENF